MHLFEHRHEISGLKMVYEPPTLRFFTARFEPLPVGVKKREEELALA